MEIRSLGRYEISGELGRGSMGVVYRAHDKRKRVRQNVLARMVGITPGALTNFEKGRGGIPPKIPNAFHNIKNWVRAKSYPVSS